MLRHLFYFRIYLAHLGCKAGRGGLDVLLLFLLFFSPRSSSTEEEVIECIGWPDVFGLAYQRPEGLYAGLCDSFSSCSI